MWYGAKRRNIMSECFAQMPKHHAQNKDFMRQHCAQNTGVQMQKCLYVCSKAESFKHVADSFIQVAIQNLVIIHS